MQISHAQTWFRQSSKFASNNWCVIERWPISQNPQETDCEKKRVMWKMSRSPVKILVRARWASVSWTGLAICCINCWEKAAKQSRSVYSSYSIKGCLWRTGSNMFSHHIFSATVKKRFVCVGFFLASHFVGECIRLHNVKTFSACWVQESNGMTHSSLSLFVQVG